MRLAFALALFLVPLSTSLSSAADAGPACPPAPAATTNPKPLREQQAAFDKPMNPETVPLNARLRVTSIVGPADAVPVQLLVNGAPALFDRAVSEGQIEITPKTPLPARATVVVMVDGIRSATFRVGSARDVRAPTIANAKIENVARAVPGPMCPPSPPATDFVTGTVDVDDESLVRANIRLVRASGAEVAPIAEYVSRARSSIGTFPRTSPFGVRFASGTLAPGEHATLRLVVIDTAGNASAPLDVPIVVPGIPDAGSPDASTAPRSERPASARRGC